MIELITAVKDELMALLNSSAFSTDSVEGWILIILGLFLAHTIWHKMIKTAQWLLCGVLLFQVIHTLTLTGFGQFIPMADLFKYDVLTAIAQCFVGTKICDVLLWFDSFLIVIFRQLWDMGSNIIDVTIRLFSILISYAKSIT